MLFDVIIRILLGSASLAGLYISVRWGLPRFAASLSSECVSVKKSPYNTLLGVPVWYGGIAAYGAALLSAVTSQEWIVLLGFLASIFAVLASFYLAIMMVGKLRTSCRLCWMAHSLNAVIFCIWVIIAHHS